MRLLNKSKLKIQSKVLKTFQYPPLFGPMRFMMPFCWSNFKLYFTPRSRRTHTTPRQVWRRLLQEPGRIPRTSRHLQGSLHHQSAQPPCRPACCRHGFACRPHRRRHPLGHLQACTRIGMESRMPALGAQQADMDKADACSVRTRAASARLADVVRRICSTTCPTRSTKLSLKPCASRSARLRRARRTKYTNGYSAASSRTPHRPDSTRRRRNI